MYAFQRSSCPSFFHPSTNRRMYRLLSKGLIGDSLRSTSTFVPIARAPMLVSTLVRFFDRSFQPHLDQMQHRSVDDPASHRLHKLGMWNTIEVAAEIRIHDLPMTRVDQLVDVLVLRPVRCGPPDRHTAPAAGRPRR